MSTESVTATVTSTQDPAVLDPYEYGPIHLVGTHNGLFERHLLYDSRAEILRPGLVAIMPSNVHHSVQALTIACAIIVDYRVRITDANRWITPRNEGKERDVR